MGIILTFVASRQISAGASTALGSPDSARTPTDMVSD